MVRRLALDRDGWRCQNPGCGRAGRLEVDHVRPLQHGGELFDLGNLATLCISCHWLKTSAEMGYKLPGPERLAWVKYLADKQKGDNE